MRKKKRTKEIINVIHTDLILHVNKADIAGMELVVSNILKLSIPMIKRERPYPYWSATDCIITCYQIA